MYENLQKQKIQGMSWLLNQFSFCKFFSISMEKFRKNPIEKKRERKNFKIKNFLLLSQEKEIYFLMFKRE